MANSIKLFSVRGINIRAHFTFPLILIWAAIQFGYFNNGGVVGALFGIIVITLLFAIVTLHELGHSLVALRYGVPVERIVLLPIGGVAQLKRMPEKPRQEFFIAIAGPAVNFGLALIMGLVALAFDIRLTSISSVLGGLQRITFADIFSYLFITNLFLALFNLLPAFPMDGGRVLRALLATRLEYSQATDIAATVGRGMAGLLALYGFLGGGFFTILIAFFIYTGAGQERQAARDRSVLRGLVVGQAYSRQVRALHPQDRLQDAINLTLSGFQANFPICDGERLVGLLTYPMLVEALNRYGPQKQLGELMLTSVPTVSPGDELFEAQRVLAESRLPALPVVDNGQFMGIITGNDLNEIVRLVSIDRNLLPRAAPA
jgi:Zn-dependent protease